MEFPQILQNKIDDRKQKNTLRSLHLQEKGVDFLSNDYLGFSRSKSIFEAVSIYLKQYNLQQNGSTGSRLLAGNHIVYSRVEKMLSEFHSSESALVFNSGYDANIGFFSSVIQRGDVILYDELIHASIRDGIIMCRAKSFKFKHNSLEDLKDVFNRNQLFTNIYVVTESVFSMDGDTPDFSLLVDFCRKNNCKLIVDEAHGIGVSGEGGKGEIQRLGLEKEVFARIITFGKALGCHGAAILGSEKLKEYLLNFARSFIFTTALPPHSLATIYCAYQELMNSEQQKKLKENIFFFNKETENLGIDKAFIKSNSPIHSCIISGVNKVKEISIKFKEKGFNVNPILSPTVQEGKERLRFCLHSYNSKEEIYQALKLLKKWM